MKRIYPLKTPILITLSVLLLFVASCKKDNKNPQVTNSPITPTKFGLYETDSSIYKLLYTFVAKVGTTDVSASDYDLVFDTGSGGFVLDATGILPSSMITNTGFTFTGDSTTVNGITIYNQTSTVVYGDDANTTDTVYGNLAYASVTFGDENGSIVIKRLPFFLYYKATNSSGHKLPAHEFDVLGVSPEYDVTFGNGAYVTSPFNYFDPGTSLTKGFKMAALGTNNFSLDGTYVPGVVTLGLTSTDLSSSSGFTFSTLSYYPGDGYAPIIPASLTYNGNKINTEVLFDTGTEPYSYIEDSKAAADTTLLLPVSSTISLATTGGFNYSYTTTASENLTNVENPGSSKTDLTILSLEFFLTNEYMIDFTDHKLGLKNN